MEPIKGMNHDTSNNQKRCTPVLKGQVQMFNVANKAKKNEFQ
jgi:hypothetical protein